MDREDLDKQLKEHGENMNFVSSDHHKALLTYDRTAGDRRCGDLFSSNVSAVIHRTGICT